MTPFEFMKSRNKDEVSQLAKAAGTTPEYFEQIARGYSNASIKLGKKLSKESGGVMTLAEIIPALQSDAA